MITQIRLSNFKAFANQTLAFRPLTLLTGMNGMGKSSLVQALLLLRQSYREYVNSVPESVRPRLNLNGELVQLGTGQDVLFEGASEDQFSLGIAFNSAQIGDASLDWQFKYDRASDELDQINSLETIPFYGTPTFVYSFCSLFQDNFHYLNAERLGPRTSFIMSRQAIERRQIGTRGEFATHFLNVFQEEAVEAAQLHHGNANSDHLIDQIEAWLSEISPGTRLRAETYRAIDAVQLSFGFVRGRDTTSFYRSTNVGFGLSYTLPILVAILSSKPGALVILENPEAHLHPRGQSIIGELIARAASAGIQIVVETHSDHLLNGIRIGAKVKDDGSRIIEADQVALHFFQRPEEEQDIRTGVEVISPRLDSEGRIDKWPRHFFDEWDYSLNELL